MKWCKGCGELVSCSGSPGVCLVCGTEVETPAIEDSILKVDYQLDILVGLNDILRELQSINEKL